MKRIGDLSVRQDGLITVITIHRPPHNYISRDLTDTLGQTLLDLDDEDHCRAIVVLAEGKNFCAGARHEPEHPETMAPDTHDLEGMYAGVAQLFANRKPIVAGIQGAAVGAGFGLAMLADFRIAADNARFSANFVKIGFCPGFGLPYTLPRVIGSHRAAFMFMTGRRFTAPEVAPWGLVDEVVPLDSLPDAAMALARELASNAPLGMAATRRRLRENLAEGVLAAVRIDSPEQTRLRLTTDHIEGVLAYRERRPAVFVGH